MEFQNKIFDGIEYTLVEIYHMEKYGDIYHFASDNFDIFCKKTAEHYIPIKDSNIINEIINTYDLKRPEILFSVNPLIYGIKITGVKNIRELPAERKKTIIHEQIQKLQELEISIDEASFEEKLSKVAFYSATIKPCGAFYHPGFNAIFYEHNDAMSDNIASKRIHLHEIIHALSGRVASLSTYLRITRINGRCNGKYCRKIIW